MQFIRLWHIMLYAYLEMCVMHIGQNTVSERVLTGTHVRGHDQLILEDYLV